MENLVTAIFNDRGGCVKLDNLHLGSTEDSPTLTDLTDYTGNSPTENFSYTSFMSKKKKQA